MNKRETFLFETLTKAVKTVHTPEPDMVYFHLTPGFKGVREDYYRYAASKKGIGFVWVPYKGYHDGVQPNTAGNWVGLPRNMSKVIFAVAFPILLCEVPPDRLI